MELGLVRKIDIDHEMQQSYLDYAMSVIVSRALPDARDGLKPVQRRILYAMYDMGLRANSSYKKSARIVGEVLGKYHPHGDMAVYEAMARMAQDFSMRYMLVDGQGNFGSVDGDPPAAMRYTEARLTPIAIEMLAQIEKNTVDFLSNFDETMSEPEVLPAAVPSLLVNGAAGIAVGMATNIPPHNLGEVVDALVFMLEQWENLDDIPVEKLMTFVKGPDFPTGGIIIQDPQGEGLTSAYGSGRGKIIVQARAHLEEMVRGRNRIIVTELPYLTNKSSLIERIAELVRDGSLEGIADLRDELDRHGMRIVIELTKTADHEKILRELYRRTPMQSTFGIALLALVDGEPRLLSLKQALRVYLEHRLVVVRRRSEFDLDHAQRRAHVLEGLRIALQFLDEVIALIRKAPDAEEARTRLMKRFKLSEIQAQAILDMQLRRLAALERKKIEEEYKALQSLIKELEALLRSPKRMREVVRDELLGMRQAYGDKRRTTIVHLKEGVSATTLLYTTDATPSQTAWVGVTKEGKLGRIPGDQAPRLTGQDLPRWLVQTNTHQTLYLASSGGQAAAIPVHAVPEVERFSEGIDFAKASPLDENTSLAAVFALPAAKGELHEDSYLLSVTRKGLVKKTATTELPGPSAQTFTLVKVNEGDALGWVLLTAGQSELILATARGMAIRFAEDSVRPMGLVAAGVNGVKLAEGDELIGALVVPPADSEILLLASDGKAKRVPLAEFPLQGRYGQGVFAWKLAGGSQLVGALGGKAQEGATVWFEKGAPRAIQIGEAGKRGRSAQGQHLIDLKGGERLLGLAQAWDALSFWGLAPALPAEAPSKVRKPRAVPAKAEAGGATSSTPRTAKASASAQKPAARASSKSKTAAQKADGSKQAAAPKTSGKAPKARSVSQPELFAGEALPSKPAGVKPAAKKGQAKPASPAAAEKPAMSRLAPKTTRKPEAAKEQPAARKRSTPTQAGAAKPAAGKPAARKQPPAEAKKTALRKPASKPKAK